MNKLWEVKLEIGIDTAKEDYEHYEIYYFWGTEKDARKHALAYLEEIWGSDGGTLVYSTVRCLDPSLEQLYFINSSSENEPGILKKTARLYSFTEITMLAAYNNSGIIKYFSVGDTEVIIPSRET